MFGQVGRTKEDSSILDAFKDQVKDLQKNVGAKDRAAVGDYLDSVPSRRDPEYRFVASSRRLGER